MYSTFVLALGGISFVTICGALAIVHRDGGWHEAMKPNPEGIWTHGRRLVTMGAVLSLLFMTSALIQVGRLALAGPDDSRRSHLTGTGFDPDAPVRSGGWTSTC